MDDQRCDGPYATRSRKSDRTRLGSALNGAGARYLLIGGFAVIARGGTRTTKDIDLLIDPHPRQCRAGQTGVANPRTDSGSSTRWLTTMCSDTW